MKQYARRVVQLVVYRRVWDRIEYLVLKRSSQDGGWWQPLNGQIEEDETEIEALWRELNEETGAVPSFVSDQIYSYEYDTDDGVGVDFVYAVEVHHEQPITVNAQEHEAYAWLPVTDAVARLKYIGNKESLLKAHATIK